MIESEFFLIAEIKSVYNEQGFVTIISHSDIPDRFFSLDRVYLDIFGDKKEFFVEKVEWKKNFYILKFKNFNCSEDVEFLLGSKMYIDSERVPELSGNEYFVHDLLNSKVYRNGSEMGVLKDVLSYPANDVYVIIGNDGKELLIPAVKEFIESFDPAGKVIVLAPGGEIYDSDNGNDEN